MIERKVAQRARARLPARPARGDRRLRRLVGPHRRARPRGRRRPRPRPRARRQARGPERRRRRGDAATCSRSPTPTRSGRPTRCASLVGAVRRPAASATSAARCASPTAAANEEGAYWRYEMAVRELESGLGGVTAGNGAIYATRRDSYLVLDPSRSHDLSFPFELTKRGWRAVYAPDAVAEEKMVPTIEGEFARKRRMMSGLWDIVLADGMLSPRGYEPIYAFEIYSHRALRYASPVPPPGRARDQHRAARPGRRLHGDPRRSRRRCWSPRRSARSCRCARSGSPTTTSPSPPRSRSGCGTASAAASRAPGRRRRGRGEPRHRRRRSRGSASCSPRRCSSWRRSRSASDRRGR